MTTSPGATQDEIRRRNVSTLLRQVHVHGALSRAQLTGFMGLNRSTIKALVGELTDAGLVNETIPETGLRAGRPSHVVGFRSLHRVRWILDRPMTLALLAAFHSHYRTRSFRTTTRLLLKRASDPIARRTYSALAVRDCCALRRRSTTAADIPQCASAVLLRCTW